MDFRILGEQAKKDKINWILGNPVYTGGPDFTLMNYSNPDRRAKVIANLTQSPGFFNPFPGQTMEEQSAVREKLKQKGYDIMSEGEEALIKYIAELNKQATQREKQARAQLEQKKPEELTEEEAQYLKWLNSKGGTK